MLNISLQTIVVTGGSDGMGKAVACQLAEKGANVVIVARTVQKLREALEAIKVDRLPVSVFNLWRSHQCREPPKTSRNKDSTISVPT
jgi:short-subunit dehydrogenase